MSVISSVGTYLPPWTDSGSRRRVCGPDEDALTMAVAAGRAADPSARAERVALVWRDMPLLEGGNGAVLLAGLSLSANVAVREVLGGAPAALDELVDGRPGTLVIAAENSTAGCAAAAVLLGSGSGTRLHAVNRQTRSLPVVVRGADGYRHEYGDPRLQKQLGAAATLEQLNVDRSESVVAAAGLDVKQLADFHRANAVSASDSAASLLRAIIAAIEEQTSGLVIAAEQASMTVTLLDSGPTRVHRVEREPRGLPASRLAQGPDIPISLAAYSRAFDAKLRWQAAVYGDAAGEGAHVWFPPRTSVDADGRLRDGHRLEALPRRGRVYTQTTVHLPVPGIASPYSLAVIQLEGSPVRALLKVTGVPAGEVQIGQAGSVVLRKIATRSGVPDYGPAFLPSASPESIPDHD